MTSPNQQDVAALVARVANAINIARYQTPDGLPARELHEEDGRTQEYAMRLARAAVSEFAPLLSTLAGERDGAERALLTVQNAAKTVAAAHGTELEHLRQNASFDHSLRAEVESLRQHNSEMTDALTAAEAQVGADERRFEQIRTILVNHLDEPERAAFWIAVEGRDAARTALLAGTPPSGAETQEKAS